MGAARSQFEDPKPWDVMRVSRTGQGTYWVSQPNPGKGRAEIPVPSAEAKEEQLARDREGLEEAWQELGLEEEPCGSCGSKRRRFQGQ